MAASRKSRPLERRDLVRFSAGLDDHVTPAKGRTVCNILCLLDLESWRVGKL